MEFTNFFYPDSHNDAEASFVLELISLFQKEFKLAVNLRIHTQRDISHLINKYLWDKLPTITSSDPDSGDCYIDLFQNPIKFKASRYILSSQNEMEGVNVHYVPDHLLKSVIESDDIQSAKVYSVANVINENGFKSSRPSKRISLFYSDEMREWLSLVEASDALISFWYRHQDADTKLELINLNQLKNSSELKNIAFTSDRIVFLKITPLSCEVITGIRKLNPEVALTFHGFESASVFFANTFLYGVQDYIKEEDLWIFSCQSDEDLARLSWEKINSVVKPLKFPSCHKNLNLASSGRNLLFFGRITEQKNLHEGLFAVKILEDKMRKENRKFKIFGYEDFLGVPNLRIPSLGYLEYLYKLSRKLKIADLVEFHPAVRVDKMAEELQNGIFFSPSVHSDENFGLVAFRALNHGVPAVVSHWGGHRDFKLHFEHVNYFNVYQTAQGPKCNPFEMAATIMKTWSSIHVPAVLKAADYGIPVALPGRNHMRPTAIKKCLESRISASFPWRVRKWPLYGKIFQNYGDQKYQLSLKAYGALKRHLSPSGTLYLSPEVENFDSEIKVLDCRAGVLRYPRMKDKTDRKTYRLDKSEVHLSKSELSWLWENGYIYSTESYEL